MLVDGSIVVVENVVRHLTKKDPQKRSTEKIVVESAKEVGKPITFAILIVVAVFLPILSLEGTEGKMFSPMAYTICFALLGSILAALSLAPALSFLFLKNEVEKETAFFKFLKPYYLKSLKGTLKKPIMTVMVAVIATAFSFIAIWNMGTEFIPTLEEGSIMIGATMAPSISLDEAVKTIQSIEKKLIKIKDVHEVISRIGRPEAGSHPHPVNYAEIHIELKPPSEWSEYSSKDQIQERVRDELKTVTGLTTNFTQPIQNAFDELLSGTKAQIAINVYGENLNTLKTKAEEILHATQGVKGFTDVAAEQSFGQPQIKIVANRDACARYGIEISEILELVETAIGGRVIDQLYLNTRRYDIYLRYKQIDRSDVNSLKQLIVHSDNGKIVSLEQVADIQMVEGPIQINRQNSQRRWVVHGNIKGRALSEVVEDIRQAISLKVKLPTGYFVEFGGQFENQQRAMGKLKIIIPVVIGVIFLLLWLTFNSLRHASIVILNVPMALIGGVTGLIITGQYLSVPASVGFIALFGIAMQDAVVLITDFNDYRKMGFDLHSAIVDGAMIRFRAVLMTTLTTLLGLLPLLLSTSAGSEIQRPLAATVVFGLASSTLLTLYVIPSVYKLVEEKFLVSDSKNSSENS